MHHLMIFTLAFLNVELPNVWYSTSWIRHLWLYWYEYYCALIIRTFKLLYMCIYCSALTENWFLKCMLYMYICSMGRDDLPDIKWQNFAYIV